MIRPAVLVPGALSSVGPEARLGIGASRIVGTERAVVVLVGVGQHPELCRSLSRSSIRQVVVARPAPSRGSVEMKPGSVRSAAVVRVHGPLFVGAHGVCLPIEHGDFFLAVRPGVDDHSSRPCYAAWVLSDVRARPGRRREE